MAPEHASAGPAEGTAYGQTAALGTLPSTQRTAPPDHQPASTPSPAETTAPLPPRSLGPDGRRQRPTASTAHAARASSPTTLAAATAPSAALRLSELADHAGADAPRQKAPHRGLPKLAKLPVTRCFLNRVRKFDSCRGHRRNPCSKRERSLCPPTTSDARKGRCFGATLARGVRTARQVRWQLLPTNPVAGALRRSPADRAHSLHVQDFYGSLLFRTGAKVHAQRVWGDRATRVVSARARGRRRGMRFAADA
jgi:hypothetical protein